MNLKLLINIKDVDKTGKIIKEKEFEANSLVEGFIGILCAQMSLGGSISVNRIGNSTYSTPNDNDNFNINSASGDNSNGIVVGTSSTAVTVSDYALGSIIAHGTDSGELEYSANEMSTTFTTSGSDAYFDIRRTFTNNSGADITINEIGIYTELYSSSYTVCIDRTIQSTTIADGNGAVITYRFQVSV